MKNSMRLLGTFFAGLVLLPGCMRVPLYKRKPLRCISNNCSYRTVEKNVIVRAKKLSKAEKYYLFNAYISDNDLQVIYFSIHNLSDVSYILFQDGIDLELVSYKNVMKSLKKTNTVSRFVGAGVGAAVVMSPDIIMSCLAGKIFSGIIVVPVVFTAAIIAMPLSIAFLVQGIKSVVMNARIKKDLKEKIMDESIIIPSGGQYEGLIFVKSLDYTPEFTLTLHEKNIIKNSITFDVDVRQT